MKKSIITIIIFLAANYTFAQEITTPAPAPEFYKHEVGITYGALAMPYWMHLVVLPILSGSINLDYYYNFNKMHSIGVGLSFASDYFEPTKWRVASMWVFNEEGEFSNYYSIHLGYRITYAQKGIVSFYSSAFLGAFFAHDYFPNENPTWRPFVEYHVTFFGMTIGKKNCATIELGLGTKGVLQVGYKYRFNPKKTK